MQQEERGELLTTDQLIVIASNELNKLEAEFATLAGNSQEAELVLERLRMTVNDIVQREAVAVEQLMSAVKATKALYKPVKSRARKLIARLGKDVANAS